MSRRLRLAAVAAVLAAGGAAAGFLGRSPPAPGIPLTGRTPSSPLPAACQQLPADHVTVPSWFPSGLPMPPGSYASQVPEASGGLHRVVFTVKGSLRDFVRHALSDWPRRGWKLGRGEAEPGEAEDNFIRGTRYGVFRARSIYCDAGWTWVLVVVNDETPSPSPS